MLDATELKSSSESMPFSDSFNVCGVAGNAASTPMLSWWDVLLAFLTGCGASGEAEVVDAEVSSFRLRVLGGVLESAVASSAR